MRQNARSWSSNDLSSSPKLEEMAGLSSLPRDCLIVLFLLFKEKDVRSLSLSCKKFACVTRSSRFLRAFWRAEFFSCSFLHNFNPIPKSLYGGWRRVIPCYYRKMKTLLPLFLYLERLEKEGDVIVVELQAEDYDGGRSPSSVGDLTAKEGKVRSYVAHGTKKEIKHERPSLIFYFIDILLEGYEVNRERKAQGGSLLEIDAINNIEIMLERDGDYLCTFNLAPTRYGVSIWHVEGDHKCVCPGELRDLDGSG
jgi:hypothetical protein